MPRCSASIATIGLTLLILAAVAAAEAQSRDTSIAEQPRWSRHLRVTDNRLADALEFLASTSSTADRALSDIEQSRLPVTIGTPAQLVELMERDGGSTEEERTRLLAATSLRSGVHGGPAAWVMIRSEESDDERWNGWVTAVWLAIEADSVESWIRHAGGVEAERHIRQDFLAILAHEFVAHIGSIAASRRITDLCDDPTPEQRARSAQAALRGEPEPPDGDMAACAIQVENRVRAEVNGFLAGEGAELLPIRSSYSLDSLNFERARRRLYPPPAHRLRPLAPIRN